MILEPVKDFALKRSIFWQRRQAWMIIRISGPSRLKCLEKSSSLTNVPERLPHISEHEICFVGVQDPRNSLRIRKHSLPQ
jgi:hypothetical protein